MGALTPLVQEAKGKRRWFVAATAYTIAGALTSAMIGAAIGAASLFLLPKSVHTLERSVIVAVVVSALAARELGLVRFPLPCPRRQTNPIWAKKYGDVPSAMFWGADIGLTFTTRCTFSGGWAVALVAAGARSPLTGSLVLGAYWLGRTLSVWLAPSLLQEREAMSGLSGALGRQNDLFRMIHVGGLIALVALLVTSVVD